MRLNCLALLLVPGLAMAQGGIAFDVASVKPSPVDADSSTSDIQPGRFRGTNRTVEWMMRIAYGVQAAQISGGPSWLRSAGFDITAKTDSPEAASMKGMQAQIGPLLRQLLEDRFQLKVHRETRSAPVYSLVAGKGAPQLKASEGGEVVMNTSREDGKLVIQTRGVSMAGFAGFLSKQLQRPVTDKTGLTGVYNLRLEWAPDSSLESTAGSVFSAVQEQLGLKLDSAKGSVEVVVVDSIAKPSAN